MNLVTIVETHSLYSLVIKPYFFESIDKYFELLEWIENILFRDKDICSFAWFELLNNNIVLNFNIVIDFNSANYTLIKNIIKKKIISLNLGGSVSDFQV